MPRIVHVVEHNYKPTFRSSAVAGMFDVPVSEKLTKCWDINIPIEEREWKIGLIVGASGSGKTTIANELYPGKIHSGFEWRNNCLLDDFPNDCEVKTITEILSKVGFSSPPQWLLSYGKLSNGQKFRVELARCLLEYEDIFIYDEFSSFVDRQVAQISAHAFQKALRKYNKKFIAVTCHYDIEGWLQPDWVLDISTGEFKWGCLRRPEIRYEIRRVHHKMWRLFREHHYLSADLNHSAICYAGFIDGRPVSFDAWLPFFGKLSYGKGKRSHRSVVLPDFQGLGLGNIIFMELTRYWANLGFRIFSCTSHPAEIKKRIESGEWKITHQGRTAKDGGGKIKNRATGRLTFGSEYIGNKSKKISG